MPARVIRSGVVEAEHAGAVAVVDADGKTLSSWGDIDKVYFARSMVKPFQAMAAIEAGASFSAEQLAVVCSSHGAHPIHTAFVRDMLGQSGLGEEDLACPPAWPWDAAARDLVVRAGHRHPRRIWHNCSGKHAGLLRACVASGWSVETYLDAQHPIQALIRDELAAALGSEIGAAGVDGCGAPVYEASTRQLARAYAVLAVDPRFDQIRDAMGRFGSLTARSSAVSAPSRWWDVVVKQGAEGCLGMAVRNRFGIAFKSFDGGERPLWPAVLDVASHLGVAPDLTRPLYEDVFSQLSGAVDGVVEVESMVTLE